MKAMSLGFLLVSVLLNGVASAYSQPAVSFGQLTTGGGWDGPDQVQGWEFVPQTSISVIELGLYDGRTSEGFLQPHQVAIWNANGNLITTASIPQGDSAPLLNNFRYVDIPSVQLSAGETYVIGAFLPAPVIDFTFLWDRSALTNGAVSFDPRIEFVAYRAGLSPGGISFPESRFVDFVGGFGPNFTIAVPEPSTFTLLLSMVVVSVMCKKKTGQ
jgi:hypothetical protein